MAAIGAMAADIHMAEAGSPTAGAILAVAVTPEVVAIPEVVAATPAEADMDIEWGTVVISSSTGAAGSTSGKSKLPNLDQKRCRPC